MPLFSLFRRAFALTNFKITHLKTGLILLSIAWRGNYATAKNRQPRLKLLVKFQILTSLRHVNLFSFFIKIMFKNNRLVINFILELPIIAMVLNLHTNCPCCINVIIHCIDMVLLLYDILQYFVIITALLFLLFGKD